MRYIFLAIAFFFATPVFAVQDSTHLFLNPVITASTTMIQYCQSNNVLYADANLCGSVDNGQYFFGTATAGSYSNLGIEAWKTNTATSSETYQWNDLQITGYSDISAQGFTWKLIRLNDVSIQNGKDVWNATVIRSVVPSEVSIPWNCTGTDCYGHIFSETLVNDSKYGYLISQNVGGAPFGADGTNFCTSSYSSAQTECTNAGFGTFVGYSEVGQSVTWDIADVALFDDFGVHVFDTAGFTPGSNPLRAPDELNPESCNNASSTWTGSVLCNAFDLLFRPSTAALGYAETTYTKMLTKFPFSYAIEIQGIASSSITSATSTISIPILNINGATSSVYLFNNTIYNQWIPSGTTDAIRLIILYALWLGFAYSIYSTINKKETLS